jgi:hypothetical protein
MIQLAMRAQGQIGESNRSDGNPAQFEHPMSDCRQQSTDFPITPLTQNNLDHGCGLETFLDRKFVNPRVTI